MSISVAIPNPFRVEAGNVVSAVISALPVLTSLAMGGYFLLTYLDQKGIERVNKQFEARRPFVEQKAKLYLETTVLIGELASRPRTEVAWTDNERRFSVLLWSELPAYEASSVQSEMEVVSRKLETYKGAAGDGETSRLELQEEARRLSKIIGDDLLDSLTLK